MRPRLLALAAAFALGPSAALAAWTAPAPLGAGTRATSAPSCATVADTEVVCAVRNTAHKLAVNRYRSGAWTGWTVLTGVITSAPSCAPRGTREVVCVARNTANKLLYTIFNGTSWRAPAASPGGAIFSAPSCARVSATRILCAARGAAGKLTFATLAGTAWSAFTNVGNHLATTAPGCASDSNGGVVCASVENGSFPVFYRFIGTAFSGTHAALDQTGVGAPTCTDHDIDLVACFFPATDSSGRGALFRNGTSQRFPFSIGGILRSPVQCANTITDLICLTIGLDSNAYFNIKDSVGWTGWSAIAAASIVNDIACARFQLREALCVFTDAANNQLYSRRGLF